MHDEIEEMFASYATAETGGLSLHEYTCLAATDRWRAQEDERRSRREVDPSFAAHERRRWSKANERRRLKKINASVPLGACLRLW